MTTSRQHGFSLLEMMGAMAVATAMLLGLTYWIDMGVEDSKGQQAALYQKRFTDGVGKFIQDPTWNAYIKANATTTVPVKVMMSNLTAGNFIAPGSGALNAYGQTPCGLIYYSSVSDRIDALITTEGGTPIPEKQLAYVASNAGDGAGFVSSATPAVAKGAYGGWTLSLPAYTDTSAAKRCSAVPAGAGSLATMYFKEASGTLQSEFLYRDAVPGRPDLNTMNVPILMSASTVQTLGAACPTNGAIARDTNGAVLSCQSGTWKSQGSSYWQDPVANFAALPTCDAAASWQTRVVESPNGAVAGNTGPRAYTCNGTSWQPLALDNDGNLTVAGTATLDKLAGDLEVVVTVVKNTACSPNGRIAREADGSLLSCKLGTWQSVGGGGLGVGQTWQSVSRSFGVTYVNNTGKPIMVNVYVAGNSQNGHSFYVNGQLVTAVTTWGAYSAETMSVVVPDGASYVAYGFWLYGWYELR